MIIEGGKPDILVSIIIVNYNSVDYLRMCLDSIYASTNKASYEIIVIDNASRDNTFNLLSPRYPEVSFIKNEKNSGFAHANNQGIFLARGKYLLLLNPDTLVIDDAIDVMVNFLESNPNAGACGCKVLNEDGSLQPSVFGFPTLLKELGHLFRVDRVRWLTAMLRSSKLLSKISRTNFGDIRSIDAAVKVDYLLGACLMLRASLIARLGPLDDKIFMYIEDTEICYRISTNGHGVFYVPYGEIIHFGGKSAATDDQRMLLEYTRSRLYFYRKYYGSYKTFALKAIIIVDMLVKMLTIWFLKYRSEMQQIQTRYKNTDHSEKSVSYIATLPARVQSLKLYCSIVRMVITY
jgi:GT2 family glycosyltransferase